MDGEDQSTFFSASKTTIFGITLALALFAPAGIQWTSFNFQVFSMAWTITNVYASNRWLLELMIMGDWGAYLPIALLRCLFAYQLKRYYDYKARLGVTLFFGWAIECFLPLFTIINVFYAAITGFDLVALAFPTPFMVVVAWFLIKKNPRGDDKDSWIEKEPARTWGPKVTARERRVPFVKRSNSLFS
jgi:hypothetical protein